MRRITKIGKTEKTFLTSDTVRRMKRVGYNLLVLFTFVFPLITLAITCYWIFHYSNFYMMNKRYVNIHHMLALSGMICLGFSLQATRTCRIIKARLGVPVHIAFGFIALLMFFLSIVICYFGKSIRRPTWRSFWTLHSWLGLVSFFALLGYMVISTMVYKVHKTSGMWKVFAKHHIFIGIFVFGLLCLTSFIGNVHRCYVSVKRGEANNWHEQNYHRQTAEGSICNLVAGSFLAYVMILLFFVSNVDFKSKGKGTTSTK